MCLCPTPTTASARGTDTITSNAAVFKNVRITYKNLADIKAGSAAISLVRGSIATTLIASASMVQPNARLPALLLSQCFRAYATPRVFLQLCKIRTLERFVIFTSHRQGGVYRGILGRQYNHHVFLNVANIPEAALSDIPKAVLLNLTDGPKCTPSGHMCA